jgi:RND family efflux transporter MFP subunit
MKQLIYLLIPAVMLASCGGNKTADADKQKPGGKPDSAVANVIPVSVMAVQPTDFISYIEVQSAIAGDENILATSQAAGIVKSIAVHVGQKVSKGQVLAILDASAIEQQIEGMSPQLTLTQSIYEKQQNLWSQNIGTEVQLMTAKANYESAQKQVATLKAQRDMYRVVSSISGVVDAVNLKVGEACAPGMNGIRVVSYDKLKAEATLGENYLGKVKQGDRVILELPDISDTIKTTLSYVSQAVDPVSRAFTVQVSLANNSKMHPNMACIMKIQNYESKQALVVPVSVIQKTSQGTMLYIADGNKAKSVYVTVGNNANGQVEILSGLKAGDQVVVKGFEELNNGQPISIM